MLDIEQYAIQFTCHKRKSLKRISPEVRTSKSSGGDPAVIE
jgi:hypothetical protein